VDIMQLLQRLNRNGITIILVTHEPDIAKFARRILRFRDGRMQEEVRQRAEVLFLARELFATPGRDAILVLVSRFERRVVVVPDAAWRGRVSTAEWGAVVERMTPLLAGDRIVEAFGAGFDSIAALLAAKGMGDGRPRQLLSDTLVQGDAPEGSR